jgi:hypothetical protein
MSRLEEDNLAKPCVVSAYGLIAIEGNGKYFEGM